jgi:hypothetical protein
MRSRLSGSRRSSSVALKSADRISMRGALQRLLARLPQILNRLGDVIATTVMMRQLAQMIVHLLGEHRLESLRRPRIRRRRHFGFDAIFPATVANSRPFATAGLQYSPTRRPIGYSHS